MCLEFGINYIGHLEIKRQVNLQKKIVWMARKGSLVGAQSDLAGGDNPLGSAWEVSLRQHYLGYVTGRY